ncbi:MAG: hypothetical protein SV239_10665 [Thermodesulfobacteriota bacterium]|jgi:hypothetical protein|nr:hypothetical protein [Thermodesulfobacteriota bacterium]
MAKPSRFIWCGVHQQRKILESCPKCGHFPCKGLTAGQIARIAESTPLEQTVTRATKRRIAPMYFLVKDDQSLEVYTGTLDELPPEKAAEAVEALECSAYIVQELTWVPAGKEKKVKIAGAGKKALCVLESSDGTLSLTEADPAERIEEGAKLYPVDKRLVRQYVPVKINLESEESSSSKQPVTTRRKSAAKK